MSQTIRTVVNAESPRFKLIEPIEDLPEFNPLDDLQSLGLKALDRIGDGGMGMVDAAQQGSLSREVAIKRLRYDRRALSMVDNLKKEALLLGRLDHPNVPPIYDLAYDDDGYPVVIMKRIRGASWKELIRDPDNHFWTGVKQDKLGWGLSVFVQICNAIAYAHSRNILHLDIKAENIMLGGFGEVYLIDWGIALEWEEGRPLFRNLFSGTPTHAAPEMFFSDKPLTAATDVYLLGATLFEILTGKPIRRGRDLKGLMKQAIFPKPLRFPGFVAPELQAICERATATNPKARYQSAKELADALLEYLELRDALDTYHAGKRLLDDLVEKSQGRPSDRTIHRLAFQCHFAFEEALRKHAGLKAAKHGIITVLRIMFYHELGKGALQHARRYAIELKDNGASNIVMAEVEEALEKSVSKRMKNEELNTQIQYKLMESLIDKTMPK